MSDEPRWLSPKRASVQYGLGLTSLYALLADGRLNSTKIGARRLISVSSLNELFAASTQMPLTGAGKRKGTVTSASAATPSCGR